MADLKKGNLVRNIIVAVILVAVLNYVIKIYYSPYNHKVNNRSNNFSKSSVGDTLMLISENINKNCPLKFDSNSTLLTTAALPNQTFAYNYSTKIDTSKFSFLQIKEATHKSLLNNARTNPAAIDFRRMKVTLMYNYSDEKSDFLFRVTIFPNEY